MHSNYKAADHRKISVHVICVVIISTLFLLSACGGGSSSTSNNTVKKGTVQITGVAAQ